MMELLRRTIAFCLPSIVLMGLIDWGQQSEPGLLETAASVNHRKTLSLNCGDGGHGTSGNQTTQSPLPKLGVWSGEKCSRMEDYATQASGAGQEVTPLHGQCANHPEPIQYMIDRAKLEIPKTHAVRDRASGEQLNTKSDKLWQIEAEKRFASSR